MPSSQQRKLPERPNSDSSIYRRQIRVVSLEEGRVLGALEDNPHHFQIEVRHDGERVTAIEAESIRFPWATCPGAALPLQALVGMPLAASSTAVGAVTRARENCTHLFDLAGVCVAQAYAQVTGGRRGRDYDCEVADAFELGPGYQRARLRRDGLDLLDWVLDRGTILRPALFAGVDISSSFLRWAYSALDAETAEAAIVLRRACYIAPSRRHDYDAVENGSDLPAMLGTCHTFTPGRVEEAKRIKGSFRDYSDDRGAMLADFPKA